MSARGRYVVKSLEVRRDSSEQHRIDCLTPSADRGDMVSDSLVIRIAGLPTVVRRCVFPVAALDRTKRLIHRVGAPAAVAGDHTNISGRVVVACLRA